VQISGYMYKFQDLTPISGHFRTNFKISGISGQRPGLQLPCFRLQQAKSRNGGQKILFLSSYHDMLCNITQQLIKQTDTLNTTDEN